MSLEKEDYRSLDKASDKSDDLKKPKISYTREFLLSISDSDICKKLPNGFDESLLCEFEDAMDSIQDRPRIPGSHPLQGFGRNEYGSSPPTRGDSSNYSRAIYGKWEGRSSGRSDQDSDSQSDRGSDSGRRYSHPSRRSWQNTERDGLLGSGSFPRPSGYVSGISAAKARVNERYQLNKSNEPYHPPRPYKAVPYSRRDTDSYNDETFGSMECSNEDRAEEERRRRASFEMMRKEQQKALQEKQMLNLEKHKSIDISNFSEVLEDKKEEKGPFARTNEQEVSAAINVLSNDLEKSGFASHHPASRPLVPPGFKNSILEKSSGSKYQAQHPLLEEGKPIAGEGLFDPKVNIVPNVMNLGQSISQEINLADGQLSEKTPLLDQVEKMKSQINLDVPIRKLGMEDQLPHKSSHLDSHGALDDPEIVDLNVNVLEDKMMHDANKKSSASLLEKIFGGTLSTNDDGSGSAEDLGKPADIWSPNSAQSSKFVQWFFEEEAKPADSISSGRPSDLLSLIASSDKGRHELSDSGAAEHFPSDFSVEQSSKLTLGLPSAADGVTDQAYANNKDENHSAVLTCEDLEQSILTEYGAKSPNFQPLDGWSTKKSNTEQPSEHVDDQASLHLLSLLQGGTNRNNATVNSGVGINLGDKPLASQERDMGLAINEHKGEDNGTSPPNLGKTLTLEMLFGSAFMKELKSAEAPVSVQRGQNETDKVDAPVSIGLPFPISENVIPSSAIDKNGLQRPGQDHRFFNSNHGQQTKPSKAENWLGIDDFETGTTSSKRHPKEILKHDGFEGVAQYQPPEENINSVADRLNHQMSTLVPTHNFVNDVKFSSNAPMEIMEKLAGINAVKDDRIMPGSGNLPFTHLPYQNKDPGLPYHGLQMQQPSPQFQKPQMAQLRPLYSHLDPHVARMNSQLKFLGPETQFNHDSPPANHQFPSNMIQDPFDHPNAGIPGLEIQSHASVLQQMQMPGNHNHVLRNLPWGGPISSHSNQATGLIQEINEVQGFPVGPHQHNIGSPGLPVAAPDMNSGSNPPETFQRLIEMELRASSKHAHPLAPAHNQGLYGRDVR